MPVPLYAQLQQVALVGTRRLPLSRLPVTNATTDSITLAMQRALHQADTPEPLRLLRASTIAAVAQRASWEPDLVAATDEIPSSPDLSDESGPPWSNNIVQSMCGLVSMLETTQHAHLGLALLHHLHQAQQLLPPALLPVALRRLSSSYYHKPRYRMLLSVFGTRGHWLASQHKEWQWINECAAALNSQQPDDLWQHGSLEQRQILLERERQSDPDAARERLVAAFDKLNAKERRTFLETLEIGLSMNDEPFLESLLQRTPRISPVIRDITWRLLNNLPESRHSQRLWAIMQNVVHKNKQGQWDIELPEFKAIDPAWERDGVSASGPYNKDHQSQSNLLESLVQHTPLRFWTQTTGMTPKELFYWAATDIDSTWRFGLYDGWASVLSSSLEPDPQWFLAAWIYDDQRLRRLAGNMFRLSSSARDQLWLCVKSEKKRHLTLEQLFEVADEINYCYRVSFAQMPFLSLELSQYLVKQIDLHARFKKLANKPKSGEIEIPQLLEKLCLYVDNEVLPMIESLFQSYEKEWTQQCPETCKTIRHKLAWRHALHACEQAITERAHC